MVQLTLRLLGRFTLIHSSAGEVPITSKKGQGLLAYLALCRDQRCSRNELVALLWSDRGEEQARHSLRQTVLTLRKAMRDHDSALLLSEGDELSLTALQVDALDFERLASQGDAASLQQATEIYAGDLLSGLSVRSEGFDDWLRAERARLHGVATHALARLATLQAEADDVEAAIETAQRLLRLDPLREDGHRLLMRLYDGTGRHAAALSQFQTCRDILRRELDIEPEAETIALHSELRGRAGEAPVAPGEAVGAAPTQVAAVESTTPTQLARPTWRRWWKWAAIGVAALIVVAGGVYWGGYLRAPVPSFETARRDLMAFPLPDKPSIAVLPFENLTGDPTQDAFVDGITEDITTALSIISEMFVISRSSSLVYRGQSITVQQVAEELGVHYVLLGSVQRSGEQVRISAQLVDALQGNQLWAERYDREIANVFALQDEITLNILTALQVEMTEGEQERISLVHGTRNLEAWVLAGHALQYLRRVTKEGNATARQLYQRATALDPDYPGSWDGLAWTHLLDARFGWGASPENSLQKAAELAQRTLALDDTRPRSYGLLGQVMLVKGDHEQAVALGEKSVALNPNGADVAALLGLTFTYTGDVARAITLIERAMRLSPYYPDWYRWSLGRAYRLAGRYSEALAALSARLDDKPEALAPRVELVATHSQMRRLARARTRATEVLKIQPRFSARAWTRMPPYSDPDLAARELEALRRGGLPE